MSKTPFYLNTLKEIFGFEDLLYGQKEVIEKVLAGHSSAAIFPTGSGKSLCYQLPALHLPHLTLVISPLLALMKDQNDFLKKKGIAAASIDSSLDYEETKEIMQRVKSKEIKILMISVERLKNERFRQFISSVPLSLLVVDEAHCISEWGHNFRPDYLKLPVYCTQLHIPQVLLLTATATAQVIEDMRAKFGIQKKDIVLTGFYRHNLHLNVLPCQEKDKLETLLKIINRAPLAPTIVYVTQQNTTETVAHYLRSQGVPSFEYHAGLENHARQNIQTHFMQGKINCIVATIAFGMGIDKSNIRAVIHYDLPKSIENYSQEIGRAGRDGEASYCTVLANRESLCILENFVYGDTPDLSAIRTVIDKIGLTQSNNRWEMMLTTLSRDCNIRPLPLKTLLVYLELEGVIEPQFSYFSEYRFKTQWPLEDIIAQFIDERQGFIQALFLSSKKAKTWYTVDFDALWQSYQGQRARAVAALDYLASKGWIILESKQMTDAYQLKQPLACVGENADKLSRTLYRFFQEKEKSEIKRIDAMLDLFETKSCLSYQLARYFADEHAPPQCGHCSVCKGHAQPLPLSPSLVPLDLVQLKAWCQPFLDAGKSQQIEITEQALSRYLCGLTTPLTTKLKARSMKGFGKLTSYPFREVKAACRKIR